jgi:hypothetical protein
MLYASIIIIIIIIIECGRIYCAMGRFYFYKFYLSL